jgi:NAD(P)-dependent dehydrogenase (short-subunit alcohol dehydrogenase family)
MDGTAVITGVGTPLASAVARAFATRGADVVVGDPDRTAADELVDGLQDLDGSATALRTDVRDEFDLERLMETASKAGAGIGAVVPAATVTHGDVGTTPLPDTSYSAYDDTMRTNARGAFAAVREAAPHLREDARVVIPVALDTDHEGGGPFPLSQTARIAVMQGFAADLEHAVGAVDVGSPPDAASAAHLEQAADAIARAATTDVALDGAILDAAELA